ncbi:hypothetical protein GPECTOR_49g487 [Gonium pectorale]|uniref:Uncharacterized protein n=1 Tax=Gonium pectorale TaxID=33097 RepID=A0A150G7Z6_GONPE|nr:hypothetical protein GPECTOR_49g487 [Gonium pectorale]|eukprot:KXZ45903.1 hypothetical protein GPECTOR_49g487 [Gonium pectorale]
MAEDLLIRMAARWGVDQQAQLPEQGQAAGRANRPSSPQLAAMVGGSAGGRYTSLLADADGDGALLLDPFAWEDNVEAMQAPGTIPGTSGVGGAGAGTGGAGGRAVDAADAAAGGWAGSDRSSGRDSDSGHPAGRGEGDPRGRRRLLQEGDQGYASAFRLVFGNFFDLVGGASRFLATLAAEANNNLLRLNWIRDLAYLATAPLDNLINSNLLPLPQSLQAFRDLLRTALNDYCTPPATTSTQLRLGEYRGPSFTLAITPAECPILVDEATGRRYIDWDNCDPAQLTITLTPGVCPVTPGGAAGRGECTYSRAFGTDTTYKVGGGVSSYTFRTSARQLDIVPVLNQFFLRGQFSGFSGDNLATRNVTGGPTFEAASAAAPAPGNGTNTAVLLRRANDSAPSAGRRGRPVG